jgi:hypothetical protein
MTWLERGEETYLSEVICLLVEHHHLLFRFVDFVFQVLAFRDQLIEFVVHLDPLTLHRRAFAPLALDDGAVFSSTWRSMSWKGGGSGGKSPKLDRSLV